MVSRCTAAVPELLHLLIHPIDGGSTAVCDRYRCVRIRELAARP